MLFDLFDLISIIAGIFYYIVMGFGFVGFVNKEQGYSFSAIDLLGVILWPALMFFRALFGFFEDDK